jgi:hypothetical protein
MDTVIKIWLKPPEGLSPDLPVKYFIHAREGDDKTLLNVLLERDGELYGYVEKSTMKDIVGKPWSIKGTKLQDLILRFAFGRKWELSKTR